PPPSAAYVSTPPECANAPTGNCESNSCSSRRNAMEASVRMVAWRPTSERTAIVTKRRARAAKTIGQRLVRERNHVAAVHVDIAVQVANQVTAPRAFARIARRDHKYLLGRGRDDVCALPVLMQHLAGMQHRPGRQVQRETRTVGRLHDPPHSASIVRGHRDFY